MNFKLLWIIMTNFMWIYFSTALFIDRCAHIWVIKTINQLKWRSKITYYLHSLYLSGWTAKTESSSSWTNFTTPAAQLQIQTDSALGSRESIWVQFKYSGGLEVRFTNPPTYDIGFCHKEDIPFTMPKGDYHIWTIKKYPTKLTMHCNGVEILDYKFSDSEDSSCTGKWSREQTAFRINPDDTASDFYRQVPEYG